MTVATNPVASGTRVGGSGNRHGVALVAIEEKLVGSVGMDVDQAWGDTTSWRKLVIRRPVGRQHLCDPPFFDCDPPER